MGFLRLKDLQVEPTATFDYKGDEIDQIINDHQNWVVGWNGTYYAFTLGSHILEFDKEEEKGEN